MRTAARLLDDSFDPLVARLRVVGDEVDNQSPGRSTDEPDFVRVHCRLEIRGRRGEVLELRDDEADVAWFVGEVGDVGAAGCVMPSWNPTLDENLSIAGKNIRWKTSSFI